MFSNVRISICVYIFYLPRKIITAQFDSRMKNKITMNKDPRAEYKYASIKALHRPSTSFTKLLLPMDGLAFSSLQIYIYVFRDTKYVCYVIQLKFYPQSLGKNASNGTIIFHFSDMAALYTHSVDYCCVSS